MPQIGQVVANRYRIVRLLGEGGMGSVFEGVHVRIGTRVAIKFLLPELSENKSLIHRFQREALAAGAIGHDAIVDIQDIGVTKDGSHYLVMEYLGGETLRDRIAEAGELPISSAAYVVSQVLSALHAAHAAGIVHRDLKPDNIFLVDTGAALPRIKLLDFGISRIVGRESFEDQVTRLTQMGTVLGTPEYMSPEQARGRNDVDFRSDLFSLGAILYECLVGRTPFFGANYNAVLAAILTEQPTAPKQYRPDIPSALEQVVLRALHKDRDVRFQSARQMFDELLPFTHEHAVSRISIPDGRASDTGLVAPQLMAPAEQEPSPKAAVTAIVDTRAQECETQAGSPGHGPGAVSAVELGTAATVCQPDPRMTPLPPAPAKRGRVGFFAGLAAFLVAMGIGAGLFVTWPEPESQASGLTAMPGKKALMPEKVPAEALAGILSAPPALAPPPRIAEIRLEGLPDDAQVYLDDTLVQDPHTLRMPLGGPSVTLRVEATDRYPFERVMTPSEEMQTIEVELRPHAETTQQPDQERSRPRQARNRQKQPRGGAAKAPAAPAYRPTEW